MSIDAERPGSFNDYRKEHPDAGVAEYTEELARHRDRLAADKGVSILDMHVVRTPVTVNEEGGTLDD